MSLDSKSNAASLYSYRQTNDTLIRVLKLLPHPEGGHFAVTHVSTESVASPYAIGSAPRAVQTTIYYLLSMRQDAPDNGREGLEKIVNHSSSVGVMHMNKSTTMHLHHAGRVVYTLLSTTKPLQVRTVVMGEDVTKGEVRQLVVDGNWWKVSEIPTEDREKVESGEVDANRVGGLISEVVTPGFDWSDHAYITPAIMDELCDGDQEALRKYQKYCRD
ncbi:hypothetical protein CBS101457_006104 [Exobasidium rhododendri]|nr:hypothetical protein CBS101457_006104 [Exobasidium rhododendri]